MFVIGGELLVNSSVDSADVARDETTLSTNVMLYATQLTNNMLTAEAGIHCIVLYCLHEMFCWSSACDLCQRPVL